MEVKDYVWGSESSLEMAIQLLTQEGITTGKIKGFMRSEWD